MCPTVFATCFFIHLFIFCRVPTPSQVSELTPIDQSSSNAKDSNDGPVCKKKRIEDPVELERLSKNLLQEYLYHKSLWVRLALHFHILSLLGNCPNPLMLQEATLYVQDYFDWTNIANFTHEVIACMLDSVKEQDHILVGKFLGHLIQINQMRKEDFKSG